MPRRKHTAQSTDIYRQVVAAYRVDQAHTEQVTFLALRLFDELISLHKLGPEARSWLEAGALLHDLGWAEGWRGHHKASLRIILESQMLSLEHKDRLIIGSIARYHRKALPSLAHDHFAALLPGERKIVEKVAALLRIADGLDRTHTNAVQDLRCVIARDQVVISCQAAVTASEEEREGSKKADLFEKVFKRKIIIRLSGWAG